MGDWLKKEETLLERNEKGEIIPQTIVLELLKDKPSITATPLTRGELQEIYAKSKLGTDLTELSEKIILEHCKTPTYTQEEIKLLKPMVSAAIESAIISLSLGMTQEETQKLSTTNAIQNTDEFQKKR